MLNITILSILTYTFAAGVGFGYMFPLMSLMMEHQNLVGALIGWHSTVYSLGVVLAGIGLAPAMLRHMSPSLAVAIGASLMGGCFLLFPLVPPEMPWMVVLWMVLRFVMGVAAAMHWIGRESWLNEVVTEKNRGLVFGLYGGMFYLGIAVGPLLIRLLGVEGQTPFLAMAALYGLALLCVAIGRLGTKTATAGHSVESPPQPIRLRIQDPPRGAIVRILAGGLDMRLLKPLVYRRSMPFLLSGLCGLVEVAVLAIFPLFVSALNLGVEHSSAEYLSFYALGLIIFQPITGWLSSRVSERILTIGLLVACAFLGIILPLGWENFWVTSVILCLWGGAMGSLYTLGLIILARYRDEDNQRNFDFNILKKRGAMTSSIFVIAYNTGGVIGGPYGGLGLDMWTPYGFLAALALAFLATLIYAIVQDWMKDHSHKVHVSAIKT